VDNSSGGGSIASAINKMVAKGVVDPLGNTAAESGHYTLSPGNTVWADTAAQLGNSVTRLQLLGHLSNSSYRHFYFFGHGSPASITAYQPGTRITKNQFAIYLGNYIAVQSMTNGHPYRLVFLDGCETGKGTMCEAFGIPRKFTVNAFFQNVGVPSRAFVGFKENILLSAEDFLSRRLSLAAFFTAWREEIPLDQCISAANSAGFTGFTNSIVVYGAEDLRRNGP